MSQMPRNVRLATALAAAVAPMAEISQAEAPPVLPQAPDPFAGDGEGGNRAERRKRAFEGGRGGHNKKPALTQGAQKRRRKLEQAGRKAARKRR